jgi:hypothetical protein
MGDVAALARSDSDGMWRRRSTSLTILAHTECLLRRVALGEAMINVWQDLLSQVIEMNGKGKYYLSKLARIC